MLTIYFQGNYNRIVEHKTITGTEQLVYILNAIHYAF